DEALKAANARIQEYEQQYGQPQQQQEQQQPRGFLDSMGDSLFGREEPRGSVPRVPQGGAPLGAPPGYRQDPWGQQPGYQGGAPMPAPPPASGGGSRRAGLFDSPQDDGGSDSGLDDGSDDADDGGFDGGDTDTA